MKQVILNIPENEFSFFMKLVSSLNFVKVVEKNPEESPYNPAYVAKILESREQAKNGQVTRVKKEDLKEFLGL